MFEKIKAFFTTEKHYIEKRIPQLIGNNDFNISMAEKMSTVFTCVDILGKTLSKLPLELMKNDAAMGKVKDKTNPLYTLVHYNPNNFTTSQSFINALETVRNLKGNAFARIYRNGNGRPLSLQIVPPSMVNDYAIVNNELYYGLKIHDSDEVEVVPAADMLHFKMQTRNGIWGLNPIEALRINLSTTYKGLKTIDAFYDNNANTPKVLKSTVSGANQKAMLEALDKFNSEYAGFSGSGKMQLIPPNTEIQELSLNYEDAQFIQTIKFNANQIAALYGIPNHMVGNTETSKYNNVEQMAIGLKGDTIAPIARMYRQEFEFKLLSTKQRLAGESIEFNLKAMIETDHKTRMEGYKTLSQMGAISPNQVARIENLPTHPDGDLRLVPMNMIPITQLKNKDDGQK